MIFKNQELEEKKLKEICSFYFVLFSSVFSHWTMRSILQSVADNAYGFTDRKTIHFNPVSWCHQFHTKQQYSFGSFAKISYLQLMLWIKIYVRFWVWPTDCVIFNWISGLRLWFCVQKLFILIDTIATFILYNVFTNTLYMTNFLSEQWV